MKIAVKQLARELKVPVVRQYVGLSLYLDFLNLFMFLLQFMGNRE